MTVSLRAVAKAQGLTGRVSVCAHLLGFAGQRVPAALQPGRPTPVISISRHVQLLQSAHININIIIAGSDLLATTDGAVIDYALFRLRAIYYDAGIGVGLVTRQSLTAGNSSGHATVTTDADITNTGHDLTADGDFVPVVMPANMNVATVNPDGSVSTTLGKSPQPGPCSPRTGSGMRSSVVALNGEGTGRTFAHEVGHYLGAPHPGTADNSLMTQTGSVPSGDPFNSVSINDGDRTTMLGHCAMQPGLAFSGKEV